MGAIIGQEGGSSPDAGASVLIPYRPSRRPLPTVPLFYRPSLYFYRHSRRPLPSFPRKRESRTELTYDGIGGHTYRHSRASGNPERS